MAIGERLFLLVWAVLSNTRDFMVEYSSDVLLIVAPNTHRALVKSGLFGASKSRSSKKSKQTKAYFRRVRRQMGLYTPPKKGKSSSTLSSLNSSRILSDEDDRLNLEAAVDNLLLLDDDMGGGGKLEDLETQLLMLKKEMAMMTNSGATTSVSQQHRTNQSSVAPPPPPPPPQFSAPPPPPPPMNGGMMTTGGTRIPQSNAPPPLLSLNNNTNNNNNNNNTNNNADSFSAMTTPTPTSTPRNPPSNNNNRPKMERSMSLVDMIKNVKKDNLLKSTAQKRSPGGTPCRDPRTKSMGASGNLQNELFAAIQKKFKNLNDSDSESDDDFNSPGLDKENKSIGRPRQKSNVSSPNPSGRALRPLNL